jgi:DNA-binding NarL/FixJ family response regulator
VDVRIRVLIADDHPAMLAAVTGLLESRFDVVGAVANGWALLRAVRKLHPDVVVVDVAMPRLGGIKAVQRLHREMRSVKVVFLSVHADAEIVRAALGVGAMAYVAKVDLAHDLTVAIDEAFAGRPFISESIPVEQFG